MLTALFLIGFVQGYIMANYINGKHVPDQTPVTLSPNRLEQMTRDENIAMLVAREFSRLNQQHQKAETFEESMDFDIEADEDIFASSQYEVNEMTEEFLNDPYAGLSNEEKALREDLRRSEEVKDGTTTEENTKAEPEQRETSEPTPR